MLVIAQAFRHGLTVEEIAQASKFEPWFLRQIEQLVKVEISTGLEVYASAGRYTSLALSPDGQLLAAGTGGGAVSVLDAKTGALLVSLPGHAERVTAVAFSDDGRVIVSGSADGTTTT